MTERSRDWLELACLGVVAGIISFFLFLIAQLAATPDLFEKPGSRLIFFGVPTWFIAGLTFDAVFQKRRGTDVVRTAAVEAPKAE